ncbi:MAG: T9SS type A sorting domain-containing protein [Candidatus Eisenbacteria bacterium]|nr:T9SS type A sorting domain-containing protein [Candidatus Eisenbacteria bacterium]
MTTCVESPIKPDNSNVVVANLTFKDSGGAIVGTSEKVILSGPTVELGTWTYDSVVAEAPAGTDSVAAYMLFVQDPDVLEGGAAWLDDLTLTELDWAGVPEGTVGRPTLHQNVPNPFNPRTPIAFDLPTRGEVRVVVYNVAGQRVATLHDGELDAGPHTIEWNGRTSDGTMAASGTYWYQLRTPAGESTRSMILLK